MAKIPGPMKVIIFFILTSMVVMFIDGLYFDNYISRPAMAMMHMEMKPTLYPDPAPPSLETYWARFRQFDSIAGDPDVPMEPEIRIINGVETKVFYLEMKNVLHEIRPGVKVPMFSFNGQIPAPTFRLTEGDHVQVIMHNNGTEPHTIHWHGIPTLNFTSDGVPGLGQDFTYPGETFWYNFTITEEEIGTQMYHCHVEAPHHMTMGMYGAIIVDPKDEGAEFGSPFKEYDEEGEMTFNGAPDHEYVWFMQEFETEHAHVSMPGDMMSMGPDGGLPWLIPSPKFQMPFKPSWNEYMINGKAFPETKTLDVKEGDIVRMRMINIGHDIHSVHIHGHVWTVTHKDGFELPAPFKADVILVGPGERYDLWFKANNPGLWPIHDHSGAETANGYEPGGILTTINYEGIDTEAYQNLVKRIQKYEEYIEHMDEDHGTRVDTGKWGMMMEMEMDMGDGGH